MDQSITEKYFSAFRSELASTGNKRLLFAYKGVCERFSEQLRVALENKDTEHLKELGLLAAHHVDSLSNWLDATTPYAADANMLILLDYWTDTVNDIMAAVKSAEDSSDGKAWKKE